MKNLSKGLFLLAAAASAALVSCSDESPWTGSDSEGGINLEFSSDARVMRQTRADDTVSPVVPDGNLFSVSLAKSDGSYAKSWSSVEAFNRETSFPMGDYSLSASFGDIDTEGFDNPYYKGETEVHVSPGVVTDARIVATLANAMVSIRYTDDFRSAFSAYSSSVQTYGHEWVVFSQNESRPAYVAPCDEVKLDLTLTNFDGKQVKIQPASFAALPRHHYVVTIGVAAGSESGDMKLDIQFDDDVVAETVSVSLGDELFNAPEPKIKAEGFESGTALNAFEYARFTRDAKFEVVAFGGLKTATLNVVESSTGYIPTFGRSVQLVGADAQTQAKLGADGVDCYGFFRNVDKMGVVDLSRFISKLPAGKYSVELQVVDAMTRTTEPVAMSVEVAPVELEVSNTVKPDFLGTELCVDVATNCADIKDEMSFKVPDANNRLVNADVKSVTLLSGAEGKSSRADLPVRYRYTLDVAKITHMSLNVEASLGERTFKMNVVVNDPEFKVTADAFARGAMFLIESDSNDATKYICDNLVFYNGETAVPTANVSHVAENIINITGLQPGTEYSAINCRLGDFRNPVAAFTTESETALPNGDFSALSETINLQHVQVGGKYHIGAFDYYNRVNIIRSEPVSWASTNQKTCYTDASTKNTWFQVPSVFAESGAVVVRSVGYSHNGKVPDTSRNGFSRDYYCKNAPADAELTKAAGELFLGTYSFSGTENRVDGIAFNSRPSAVTFSYTYAPFNGEKAEAYARVLDSSGAVIASGSVKLSTASSATAATINLTGYSFGKKADKIIVCFRSTESGVTPGVNIPSGSALQESGVGLNTKYYWDLDDNTYHALAVGSVLRVQNVAVSYQQGVSRANAAKRR